MANVRPVSDLHDYEKVLKDVSAGNPVFLTENGRGKYVIMDIDDYEKMKVTILLQNELLNGRKEGEGEGWLSSDDMEYLLGVLSDK